MGRSATHTAVVIGSGPNGLAAAIRLAEAGVAVTVLEQSGHPGGAVRTEELTLPGFRHDTFSAVHPAAVASPVLARLPLDRHGLEWVHPGACMAHPLPDGSATALYRDIERTARTLDRRHDGDGRRWAEFVTPYVEAFAAVRATLLAGFPPVPGALALLRSAGLVATADLTRRLLGSAEGLARRLFAGPDARAWLYGTALHADPLPGAAGSAAVGFGLNLLGHAVGWPSPRGGAGALIDALAGHLADLGGAVRTGARAERVIATGGRVTGVGVAGGDEVPATIVVADVMPHALVALAGDALSGWYRRALRRYVYGPATVKLDWALSAPIPWTATEAREAGTVHVGGEEAAVLAAAAQAREGLPRRPFLLVGQQSLADPARAPRGRHTAWAYTHGPQHLAERLRGERHLDAVEAQVERFAPGFRERILARHVMGPQDLQARNPNLVGGDVGGGSYRMPQAVFRPLPAVNPYRTPLHGLFIGSAATFPGAAVHGVCGDAAARAALRQAGIR